MGAFHRLHERWQQAAPALGPRELVGKALDGIHGVDKNSFAVAIARFRLLTSAMYAAGDSSIELDIDYQPHLAAGDSLLWGSRKVVLDDQMLNLGIHADPTENSFALKAILRREHDVVVGNPPYSNARDAALNTTYRQLYETPRGKYALTVPFMELFFNLAYGSGQARPTGWVGQITSNSFMTRGFGVKLVEKFIPTIDIRLIVDSSIATIPGHGTPTVIIVGRNTTSSASHVRTILGKKGAHDNSPDPSKGAAWISISENYASPGFEDRYLSVVDLARESFSKHPWTLSGGGVIDLLKEIELGAPDRLSDHVFRVGVFGITGANDAFYSTISAARREGTSAYCNLVRGQDVRNYRAGTECVAFFPYTTDHRLVPLDNYPATSRRLWPLRTELGNRATFSRGTYFTDGRPWYEWHQLPADIGSSDFFITFPELASHNHFCLVREPSAFNQKAPTIKLRTQASETDHLMLLGVLNSSVTCFWLKEKSYPRGGDPVGADGARVSIEGWDDPGPRQSRVSPVQQ